MNHDGAMATKDEKKWEISVEEEYKKTKKCYVWTPIKLKDVTSEAKILKSTWDMKKKESGVHREIMNDRGYEQVYGVHYDNVNIASLVNNDTSIKIVLVLETMASWTTKIIGVKGTLMHGEFTKNEEPIYMDIPQVFEKYSEEDYVLELPIMG